jgi:hypothetical protein
VSQSATNFLKGGSTMNDLVKEKPTYLYNMLQVNFYLSRGICPLEIGINSTTRKTWVKFGWNQTTNIYQEWCNRKSTLNK